MTIASIFAHLGHTVYQTIADPVNEHNTSLIDAGIAVEYALAQARVAYPGILQHTVKDLHGLASKDSALQHVEQVIQKLQTWTQLVIHRKQQSLSFIDAKALVKTLPCRSLAPRLERVTVCSERTTQTKIHLICYGYFPRIERKANEPCLIWGQHTFTPVSKQPDSVEFVIPSNLLEDDGHLLRGELHAPYSFLGPLHDAILPVFIKRHSSSS